MNSWTKNGIIIIIIITTIYLFLSQINMTIIQPIEPKICLSYFCWRRRERGSTRFDLSVSLLTIQTAKCQITSTVP